MISTIIFIPLSLIGFTNVLFDYATHGFTIIYLLSFCMIEALYIFTWKQWLYYFDTNFAKQTLNKEWTQFINPTHAENNWFIINKKLFGTHSSLFYKAMITLFMLTVLSITMWEFILFGGDVATKRFLVVATAAFWAILSIITLSVIRYKTPTMDDPFFIRKELSVCIYTLLLNSFFVLINYAFSQFILSKGIYPAVSGAISYFILATSFTCFLYVLSLWTIQKNKAWILRGTHTNKQMLAFTQLVTPSNNNTDHNGKTLSDMNVFQACQNAKMFDFFMQHLIKEFSIEIMLSLIEFTQFQIELRDFVKSIDDDAYDKNEWTLSFEFVYPSTLPIKSSIVFDELNDTDHCFDL